MSFDADDEILQDFLIEAGEIIETLNLPEDRVFETSNVKDIDFIAKIKELSPDIILVVFWAYLLPASNRF